MFDHVQEALDAFKLGQPIILVDDEDRENEGDIVFPATFAFARYFIFASSAVATATTRHVPTFALLVEKRVSCHFPLRKTCTVTGIFALAGLIWPKRVTMGSERPGV